MTQYFSQFGDIVDCSLKKFPLKRKETFVIEFESVSAAEMVCCMEHSLKNRDLYVVASTGEHLNATPSLSSSSSKKKENNGNKRGDKRGKDAATDKKKPGGDSSSGTG